MREIFALLATLSFFGCSSMPTPVKTVEKMDVQKFMGDWYVLAGRFTFLERDVHNGLERYSWNQEKERIDVDFTFREGSFSGPLRSIPQTAWIYNQESKTHWKVSPFWPFKLDYLVVALAKNYSWTAIGVPNQKYLWIMARSWKNPEATIEEALKELKERGYDTTNLVFVPHQWP